MEEYEIRKNNTGIMIHAGIIEEKAQEQINMIASHPVIKELILIMPDTHVSNGCVI